MSKFIVGKRIATIEWFHVEAETKEEALEAWNRGDKGVEFRGQGDAEEFLDDMIVQEWGDKSEPSVLPPLYASAPRLAEKVRILEEALVMVAAHPLETDEDDEDVEEYERRSGSDAEEMLCICIRTARAALEATEEK